MEENELCGILQREIEDIESQLTHNIAMWQVMKNEYESWCARRREEYGTSSDDDELMWEKGSSVREYHQMYIAPLEEALEEKRRNLELFRRN